MYYGYRQQSPRSCYVSSMQTMRRIKVFTDRYPWLGPLVYLLSIEFFVAQLVVAGAWLRPYSWSSDTISDLGRTACGLQGGRLVCSPLHAIMNASFIIIGIIMVSGSFLIYQEFRESKLTLLGFSLVALGGLGSALVGLFPENINPTLHLIGAGLSFLIGNISLVALGISLRRIPMPLRIYTFLSGLLALAAMYFFVQQDYGILGIGGVERIVSYPQILWLCLFGAYMSRSHTSRASLAHQSGSHHL